MSDLVDLQEVLISLATAALVAAEADAAQCTRFLLIIQSILLLMSAR
jgi:hypothetical protein